MTTPTLYDSVTSATAAIVAASEAYHALEERVALREAMAVLAAGGTPGVLGAPGAAGDDLAELAEAICSGITVGAFGGTPAALTAAIAGGVVFPGLRPMMEFWGVPGADSPGGAMTILLGGFAAAPPAYPLKTRSGADPAKGDLAQGKPFKFWFDGVRYVISRPVASDGAASGIIRPACIPFETAGTVLWVPTCTAADVLYVGGAGSGGSANVLPGGAPGGGGDVQFKRVTGLIIGGPAQTLNIGSGGASIPANTVQAGNNGGATSGFGVMAGGGYGGGAGSGSGTAATGGAGGTGSGGDWRDRPGTSGQAAANSSSAGQSNYPRGGEASGFGGGGTNNGADGNGNPVAGLDGSAPGAGGGGGTPTCRSGKGHDGAIYIFPAS